jgi:hypothetical protein
MHEGAAAGNRRLGKENYPQPKALAGLDFFVYVSRLCADVRRPDRCAQGPARRF